MARRSALVLCSSILLFTACISREPTPASTRIERSDGWLAMGTFFEVDLRIPETQVEAAAEWLAFARREIVRLERIYSRHDSESELSHLNSALGEDGIATIRRDLSPELAAIIVASNRLRVETHGALEIALGPVVDLWTEAARTENWPSAAAVSERMARVEAGRLLISQDLVASAKRSGGRIDLDAVSKGAVLDRLRSDFVSRFPDGAALFSFGQSSVVAIGSPGTEAGAVGERDGPIDADGWRLVLRSMDPARDILREIRLRDQALSMSSSLGSVHWIGNRRASHVIDPRTGTPVEGTREAVVIAKSALQADAWSTALLILASPQIEHVAKSKPDLEIWWMDDAGRVIETAGWPSIGD